MIAQHRPFSVLALASAADPLPQPIHDQQTSDHSQSDVGGDRPKVWVTGFSPEQSRSTIALRERKLMVEN
ncbi:uncharacterized protein N7483_004869 [Penicillium malachiteum]|uniref:uncharacterized protein n=1 Tax=Penicillium malachiteum TaxID=1324776 RepID=UPI002546B163|nr:uncharacterized protein N7483_004869 [Penicillium malachiteum]KAJ5730361.1 hypothetical protein N7483_004869 [Penicillium malachiteum]